MKHAAFAPSSSPRWSKCTASFYTHEQEEGGVGSIYAYEGTICHEIAAQALKDEAPLEAFLGFSYEHPAGDIIIDQNHIEALQTYIDIVMRYVIENKGSELHVEQKVWASEDSWGTSDAIVNCPMQKHIHVFDLKMGRGVQVDAKDNEQMISYGMGSYLKMAENYVPLMDDDDFLPTHVTMHIVQPRLPGGRIHDQHTMKLTELTQFFYGQIEGAINVIKSGVKNTVFDPGEKQCRWCSYSPNCKALADWTLDQAGLEFAQFANADIQSIGDDLGITTPQDGKLTDEEITNTLKCFPILEIWMKSIRDEANRRAMELARKGEYLPDLKLVESTKHRAWEDKAKAEKLMVHILGKVKAYTRKILSPAQAEKAISADSDGADTLFKLIHKPKGNPTLVSIDDKRPEMKLSAEDEFQEFAQ